MGGQTKKLFDLFVLPSRIATEFLGQPTGNFGCGGDTARGV